MSSELVKEFLAQIRIGRQIDPEKAAQEVVKKAFAETFKDGRGFGFEEALVGMSKPLFIYAYDAQIAQRYAEAKGWRIMMAGTRWRTEDGRSVERLRDRDQMRGYRGATVYAVDRLPPWLEELVGPYEWKVIVDKHAGHCEVFVIPVTGGVGNE